MFCFIGYLGFIIGYIFVEIFATNLWIFEYTFLGWIPLYPLDLFIVLGIYFILTYVAILFRILQIFRAKLKMNKKGDVEGKKENIQTMRLALFWVFGVGVGTLGIVITAIFLNAYIGLFFVTISFLIVTYAFIKDPHALFISDIKIQSVLFFDAETGIAYLTLGGTYDGYSAVSGLHGSASLQKQIAGAKNPPTLLIFGDRVFILSYKWYKGKHIAAAVITNKFNPAFIPSLNHALNKFVNQFGETFVNFKGEVSKYRPFVLELLKIFDYAWSNREIAKLKSLKKK